MEMQLPGDPAGRGQPSHRRDQDAGTEHFPEGIMNVLF